MAGRPRGWGWGGGGWWHGAQQSGDVAAPCAANGASYLPVVFTVRGGKGAGGADAVLQRLAALVDVEEEERARLRCFQHLGRCLVAARRRRSSAPRAPAAPSARVLLGAVARHAGIVDGYGVSELTASPSLPPCTRLCALSVGPEADPEHLLRSLGLCAL